MEICLVTSRETGRWVIPKGWPMKGRSNWEAAATEAYEEAGLRGEIAETPIGQYPYWKRMSDHFVLINTTVYLLRVGKQMNKWPEKDQRKRKWVGVSEAAEEVVEPGLIAILQSLELESERKADIVASKDESSAQLR